MGVQRVVLEHHRHVAFPRSEVGDVVVAEPDVPARHVFEAGDTPECRRLSTPGGTDEDEKLPVAYLQVDVLDGDDAVVAGVELLPYRV